MGIQVLNLAFQAPVGIVQLFAGPLNKIPEGWILCDGSAVSRTAYATLFSVLGTYWGTGDGFTTFNLPSYIDRAMVGGNPLYSASGPATSFQDQPTGNKYGGMPNISGTGYLIDTTVLPQGAIADLAAGGDISSTAYVVNGGVNLDGVTATPYFAAVLYIIKV